MGSFSKRVEDAPAAMLPFIFEALAAGAFLFGLKKAKPDASR
jgi:hypothetical protein